MLIWGSMALAAPPPQGTGTPSVTSGTSRAVDQPNVGMTLDRIQTVRALSPAQAAQRLPVQLRGVVTYADKGWQHFFMQDDSGGIYVRGWADYLQAGLMVEVTGVTDPGKAARMIVEPTIHPLGRTNLPVAQPLTYGELFSPNYDSAWVQVEGVIRSLTGGPERLTFRVATAEGTFTAVVPGDINPDSRRWMINTRARLQGVNSITPKTQAQAGSLMLRLPTLQFLKTLERAPTNAFAIPLLSMDEVNQGSLAKVGLHRIRVEGVVTLKDAGGVFYLQNQSSALRVTSQQTNAMEVGRSLEVVGFPSWDGSSVCLEDSIFRYGRSNATVAPRVLQAREMLNPGYYHHELGVLEGHLLNSSGGGTLTTLLLHDGPIPFQAQFVNSSRDIRTPVWREGSRLRLTGICELPAGGDEKRRQFVMLLRSPGDVQVLQDPPVISAKVLWSLIAGLSLLVLAIMAWVALLHRQVRERTEEVLEAKAILQSAMDGSQAGIVIADAPHGNLRYINKTALLLSGKPAADLPVTGDLHHALATLFQHPDGTAVKEADLPWMRALRQGETSSQEFVIRHPGKADRSVLANAAPVFDHAGRVKAGIVVFLDLTEHKKTQAELKTLRGILPICASCKKVRDDHGYWQQVDVYIRNHTEAQCSHGLCDDCLKTLYPDYADDKP